VYFYISLLLLSVVISYLYTRSPFLCCLMAYIH
jgi:hypothetical protein